MCSASINIVASVSALPTVRKLEEDYGVPYMIAEEELKEIKGWKYLIRQDLFYWLENR